MGLNALKTNADDYCFSDLFIFGQGFDTYNLHGSGYSQSHIFLLTSKNLDFNRFRPHMTLWLVYKIR